MYIKTELFEINIPFEKSGSTEINMKIYEYSEEMLETQVKYIEFINSTRKYETTYMYRVSQRKYKGLKHPVIKKIYNSIGVDVECRFFILRYLDTGNLHSLVVQDDQKKCQHHVIFRNKISG